MAAQSMEDIEFSVVIPLFNKREQVSATLSSVFAQTRLPREVLVIDNGSTDGSEQVVLRFDIPLLHLATEAQRGPGPARNRGTELACGNWIAFLDADDLWAPNHLAVLAEVIAAHPTADLVGSAFQPVSDPAGPPPPAPAAPSREIDYFAGDECDRVWTSAVAVRRQTLLGAGGFAAFPASEDADLWIRLALTSRFAISEAMTAYYRRGNGGIMEREQAASARQAPPPSPIFATIAGALQDPRYASRHAALAAYGDRRRVLFARQLAYHGHTEAMRALLQGASRRGRDWWLWRGVSVLPPAVLRLLARGWSFSRRVFG